MNRRDFLATASAFCIPLPVVTAGEPPELFELRIAPSLVHLFTRDSEMFDRIRSLRADSRLTGLEMPLVRIRDFPGLPEDEYQVLIRGDVVRRGTGGETIIRDLSDVIPLVGTRIISSATVVIVN